MAGRTSSPIEAGASQSEQSPEPTATPMVLTFGSASTGLYFHKKPQSQRDNKKSETKGDNRAAEQLQRKKQQVTAAAQIRSAATLAYPNTRLRRVLTFLSLPASEKYKFKYIN